MALSDSCFEFLDAVAAAASALAKDVHHYAAPDNPLRYGSEIDALRREPARPWLRPHTMQRQGRACFGLRVR
jgi:hypothetical protein